MKSWIALLFALILVAGCQDEQAGDLQKKGQEVAQQGKESAARFKDQVTAKLQEVSEDAKVEVLRAARAKAVEIQGQLSEIRVPTKLQELQLGAVNAQIEQIDAALEQKNLQERLKDATAQAQTARENMEKGVADAKANLDKAQETARRLSEELERAQETYKSASATFDKHMEQVRSLTGG